MAAPLESSGHPPQGDQPTIWRAPSQETAPTTRYNGRWATSSLVCVPAALRACRVLGLNAQTGTPRGRPSRGTAGTNPRTGRPYLLTLSATTSSSWTSAIACSSSRAAVVRWFGVWYFYFRAWYSGIWRRLWSFPAHRSASLLSSLVLSVPGVEVFRLLSSCALQV